MKITAITSGDLRRALELREKIDALESDLTNILNPVPRVNGRQQVTEIAITQAAPRSKRRRMSAEARRNIAAAQSARWAKIRGE